MRLKTVEVGWTSEIVYVCLISQVGGCDLIAFRGTSHGRVMRIDVDAFLIYKEYSNDFYALVSDMKPGNMMRLDFLLVMIPKWSKVVNIYCRVGPCQSILLVAPSHGK